MYVVAGILIIIYVLIALTTFLPLPLLTWYRGYQGTWGGKVINIRTLRGGRTIELLIEDRLRYMKPDSTKFIIYKAFLKSKQTVPKKGDVITILTSCRSYFLRGKTLEWIEEWEHLNHFAWCSKL